MDGVLKAQSAHFLHLADTRISRKHARITRLGWTFLLEDLGSINGTILRGEPLLRKRHVISTMAMISGWPHPSGFHAEEDKLTVHHGFEPTLLPAEPAVEPLATQMGAPSALPVVRRMDDSMHLQISAILDASMVIRLPSMTVRHDSAVDQDALRRLHAMCQVSAALGTLKNRDRLLQKILDIILEIFPAIDRASYSVVSW